MTQRDSSFKNKNCNYEQIYGRFLPHGLSDTEECSTIHSPSDEN